MHLYVYTCVRIYIYMYIHRYVYTWVLYTVYYIYTYIGAPVEECIFVGCIKHPVTDVSVICSGESHLVFGLCNHSFPRHAQLFQYLAIYISLYRYRRPVNMFHLTKDDFLGIYPRFLAPKWARCRHPLLSSTFWPWRSRANRRGESVGTSCSRSLQVDCKSQVKAGGKLTKTWTGITN